MSDDDVRRVSITPDNKIVETDNPTHALIRLEHYERIRALPDQYRREIKTHRRRIGELEATIER